MIAFDLQCTGGHTFEGWFKDGNAFEEQREKGLISCPVCEDTGVTKVPTTFSISRGASAPGASGLPALDPHELKRKITDFVESNFENVGSDFTKEALKIHYGVGEPRNIRGAGTEADEKLLRDEGIDFLKVPVSTDNEGENA